MFVALELPAEGQTIGRMVCRRRLASGRRVRVPVRDADDKIMTSGKGKPLMSADLVLSRFRHNGEWIYAGDLVECGQDLAEAFPDRFARVEQAGGRVNA